MAIFDPAESLPSPATLLCGTGWLGVKGMSRCGFVDAYRDTAWIVPPTLWCAIGPRGSERWGMMVVVWRHQPDLVIVHHISRSLLPALICLWLSDAHLPTCFIQSQARFFRVTAFQPLQASSCSDSWSVGKSKMTWKTVSDSVWFNRSLQNFGCYCMEYG